MCLRRLAHVSMYVCWMQRLAGCINCWLDIIFLLKTKRKKRQPKDSRVTLFTRPNKAEVFKATAVDSSPTSFSRHCHPIDREYDFLASRDVIYTLACAQAIKPTCFSSDVCVIVRSGDEQWGDIRSEEWKRGEMPGLFWERMIKEARAEKWR